MEDWPFDQSHRGQSGTIWMALDRHQSAESTEATPLDIYVEGDALMLGSACHVLTVGTTSRVLVMQDLVIANGLLKCMAPTRRLLTQIISWGSYLAFLKGSISEKTFGGPLDLWDQHLRCWLLTL